MAYVDGDRFLMISLNNNLIAKLLGWPAEKNIIFALRPINVGINSWVFKVKLGNKYVAVIKKYRSSNSTERLNAEIKFLKFLAKVAWSRVPKVLGSDFSRGLLATSYISGRTRSRLNQQDWPIL